MPSEEKKKIECEKVCFSFDQNARPQKTRTTDPEKAVFIYNNCMHPMMRSANGSVKLLMRIYLCPECGLSFFINILYENGIGGLFERPHYCIYCGAPEHDDYSMSCQLTRECFNPDKTKCECENEYCIIKRGEDPYVDFVWSRKDAASVRDACDKIMVRSVGGANKVLVPVHYCAKYKRAFTGNPGRRIEYCLYCGEPAHENGRIYCYLSEDCFDLRSISSNSSMVYMEPFASSTESNDPHL